MSLIFEYVKWKNFLSTGDQFTQIDLSKNEMTLITGKNGAGKSTFQEALCFLLFNKSFRNINKPQLVNSINQKNLIVEGQFKSGKNTYKVVRGMKPVIFEIYKNGELINQNSDSRDYQDFLEKQIIKMNFKSFCQVVILGSASFVPFMQLPAGHRREVIEDLLDIDIFSKMNFILKDRINKNNLEESQIEKELDIIASKIELAEKYLKDLRNTQEKRKEDLKEEIDIFTDKYNSCISELENLVESLNSIEYDVEKHSKIKKKFQKYFSLKNSIQAKMESVKNDIGFYHDADVCPTCTQAITEEFKKTMIEKKNISLQEATSGIEQLDSMIMDVEAKISELEERQKKISDIKFNMNLCIANKKNTEQYLEKLKRDYERESGVKETATEDYSRTIITLKNDRDNLLLAKQESFKEKESLSVCATLLKDGGIKSRIIKQYIPVINKLINKYLASMDFYVNFELDENFKETIRSRFRDEFSYSSFSEGEKMRINLALLFTWRAIAKLRNSASCNLLILDEVLDGSLDSNGIEELMKIIRVLTEGSNVFIISHRGDQIQDKFTNTIHFVKQNNFSRISKVAA